MPIENFMLLVVSVLALILSVIAYLNYQGHKRDKTKGLN